MQVILSEEEFEAYKNAARDALKQAVRQLGNEFLLELQKLPRSISQMEHDAVSLTRVVAAFQKAVETVKPKTVNPEKMSVIDKSGVGGPIMPNS